MSETLIEDFVADVRDGVYSYDTISGVIVDRETAGEDTRERFTAVWERPPDESRGETYRTEPSPDDDTETPIELVVRNANDVLEYDCQQNQYRRQRLNPAASPKLISRPRILTAVVEGAFDASVHGTETIGGHETQAVSITPADGRTGIVARLTNLRVWIEPQYRIPLRYRVASESASHTIQREFEWLRVEFDSSLGDDRFDVTPPEGAEQQSP